MFRRVASTLFVLSFLTACARAPTREITFWNELPILPGAVEVSLFTIRQERPTYTYTVEADMDPVEEFYDEQMDLAGWELLAKGDMSSADMDAIALWYTKGSRPAAVQIFIHDDKTYVGLVLY